VNPVILTEEELRAKCAEWQRILRLQDWDVVVSIDRARDMTLSEVDGECEWTLASKQARIRILDPMDFPPDSKWPQDMEQILVHELLHLHFAPFDRFERGSLEHVAMEQAIDLIASALVKLKRTFVAQ
jgi:hypothetical protein